MDTLTQDILHVLESTVGSTTSEMYKEFYKDKDDKTIVISVSELLDEFVGENKRINLLEPIIVKHNLHI